MDKSILHCDMNNFFASVECVLDPSLKGKPVAVCGSVKERRGIVMARNYIAKDAGVNAAEPVWSAKKKCPGLVCVPPHRDEYEKYSILAREIYDKYTDIVEPFGIDECWLDVTRSQKLFGDPMTIAYKIKEEIKKKLGLTISVGVSYNKIWAKLGSDMKKPDAITLITRDNFKELVWPLPARSLMGVGSKTSKLLDQYHINTIGDIAKENRDYLYGLLGEAGGILYDNANGEGDDEVIPDEEREPIKSIGHGETTPKDLENNEEAWQLILNLSKDIGYRLRENRRKARTVVIHIKNNRLESAQFQRKMDIPTNSYQVIAKEAYDLFLERYDWDYPIRAITVTATNLIDEKSPIQLSFFVDYEKIKKLEKVERTVEGLCDKFGDDVIL